ncbi:MAG: DUF1573 domain-containing protein [Verrucomicrobiota bacterium]
MKNRFALFLIILGIHSGLDALTWDKMTIEASPMDGDASVTVDFRYTNKTAQPVTITKAFSSCSECTTLLWEEKEIAPGESGTLVASVKVSGINGRKTKYITVATTEKKPFPDRLSLTVVMPEKLKFSEKKLRWGPGEKTAKAITINTSLPDAVPYIVQVTPEGVFSVNLTPANQAGTGHVLTITPLEADGPPRRASVRIGIKASDGAEYFENIAATHL